MKRLLTIFLFFCLSSYSTSLSTDPVSIDGETPVVSAVEGTKDVTVFCAVELSNGNPSFTNWEITRVGSQGSKLLTFNASGDADGPSSENFRVTGEPLFSGTRQSNLTILTFDRSLDNALLECLEGTTVMANFTLKLISKYLLSITIMYKNYF